MDRRLPRSHTHRAWRTSTFAFLGLVVVGVLCAMWAGARFDNLAAEADTFATAGENQPAHLQQQEAEGQGFGGTSGGGFNTPEDIEDLTDLFPTREPRPEPPVEEEPFEVNVVEGGGTLLFEPTEVDVVLTKMVLIRNTTNTRCTMVPDVDPDLPSEATLPALLPGEDNPVLESALDAAANHTVTFVSPEEPTDGYVVLRCDYEVVVTPPSDEEGDQEGGDAATEAPADEPTEGGGGEEPEPTVQVFPSKPVFISWGAAG